MKKVMHKETREIIIIDETKEPNRQHNYLHQSGVPFETTEEPVEEVEEVVKKVVKKAVKKPSSPRKNVTRKD